jgi:hypothetical protein
MRVFCVEYFCAKSAERRLEIDECLAFNMSSGFFDRVIVFSDDQLPESASGANFEVVSIGRRIRYPDFLGRATRADTTYVLANADIQIKHGVEWFDFVRPRELWAITRWEDAFGPRTSARESQDLWAVRGQSFDPKLLQECDFELGLPGCENALAARMKAAEFGVHNYCRDIRTLHVHSSLDRNYSENDRLPRPYYFPNPKRIPLRMRFQRAIHQIHQQFTK